MGADAFDLDALLAPTLEAPPTGRSVRYEGDYERIRAARLADDPDLPRGVWQRELRRADWNAVVAAASDSLVTRTKDLQIAAWLAEALVERDGFAGLAPALTLPAELLARFWDGLFPELEPDGDAEARLAPLFWLDRQLAVVVRRLAVTAPASGAPGLSFTDYANARRLERIRMRDAAAAATSEERGAVTLAAFDDSLKRTPAEVVARLDRDVDAGIAALGRLVTTADRCAGAAAPSFRELNEAIAEVGALVQAARPAKSAATPAPVPGNRRPPQPVPARQTGGAMSEGRVEARARLDAVAGYLRAHEPQAPARFLIERALAWWDRPLHEILEELAMYGDAGAVLSALARPQPEDEDQHGPRS